jgi:hypothetical protein
MTALGKKSTLKVDFIINFQKTLFSISCFQLRLWHNWSTDYIMLPKWNIEFQFACETPLAMEVMAISCPLLWTIWCLHEHYGQWTISPCNLLINWRWLQHLCIIHRPWQPHKNIKESFFVVNTGLQLHIIPFEFEGIIIYNKSLNYEDGFEPHH